MALKVDSTINLKGLLSVRTFLDFSNMVLLLLLFLLEVGVLFLTTVGVVVGTVAIYGMNIYYCGGQRFSRRGFVVAKFRVDCNQEINRNIKNQQGEIWEQYR